MGDQRPDHQGKIGGHPEGVLVHQIRELVGSRLEVKPPDFLAEGICQHHLQCRDQRRPIDIRLQKAQVDKIIHQAGIIPIHQVNQSIHQILFHGLGELIHHAKVDVGHSPIPQGKQIARVRIGMKETMLQQLFEGGDHSNPNQVGDI